MGAPARSRSTCVAGVVRDEPSLERGVERRAQGGVYASRRGRAEWSIALAESDRGVHLVEGVVISAIPETPARMAKIATADPASGSRRSAWSRSRRKTEQANEVSRDKIDTVRAARGDEVAAVVRAQNTSPWPCSGLSRRLSVAGGTWLEDTLHAPSAPLTLGTSR